MLFQNLIIVLQISRSDMEPGQRIREVGRRQIVHPKVEFSQGETHFPGMAVILYNIIGASRID